MVVTTIAPKPVPHGLTLLPHRPKCLAPDQKLFSVLDLEGAVVCERNDALNVRGRFVRLRNAVRSRERLAAKAKKAGI